MTYFALSLDTNIFINEGFKFEQGFLGTLRQFKESPVRVVLSEIVRREVIRRMANDLSLSLEALENAVKDAGRCGVISSDNADQFKKILGQIPSPADQAARRFDAFAEETGAEIIGTKDINEYIGRMLDDYFACNPPFENNKEKRKEFPDAIALLSLEHWAKKHQNDHQCKKRVLFVTNDKGCRDFCNKSDVLYSVRFADRKGEFGFGEELAKAIESILSDPDFVGHKRLEKSKAEVVRIMEGIGSEEQNNLKAEMIRRISEEIFDKGSIDANSSCCYENHLDDISCSDFSVDNVNKLIVTELDEEDDDVVISIRIPVKASVKAEANFEFSKGYYTLESSQKFAEEEMEINLLITFRMTEGEPVQMEALEVLDQTLFIDFGNVEPFEDDVRDFYDDDHDDERDEQ